MTSLIIGSIIISVLHAAIPSHWLPILALAKQQGWSRPEVKRITFVTALSHTASTVLIGLVLGLAGYRISENIEHITHIAAPTILIVMGLVFIVRHHRHKHFHIHGGGLEKYSKKNIVLALTLAMFLSPCLEIEAYFLLAGTHSIWLLFGMAFIYSIITISGMVLLVNKAYKGLLNFDSHRLEHSAGIITGLVLIITGLISIFIH